jgi:hypothetical protein
VNISSYIPSPDIAAYCEKIGHVFNPVEMAVIVAMSGKTMKEKHTAWWEIIADCPDMPIHKSMNFDARESLHDYLRELIVLEEKWLAEFYKPEVGVVYRPTVQTHRERRYDYGCYSTAGKAWTAICDYWKDDDCEYWDWKENHITRVKIERLYIDSGGTMQADLDADGEILSLCRFGFGEPYEDYPDNLDMIFIHLPMPFEQGDLVMFDNGEPRVLEGIPHWWDRYGKRISGEFGDATDMIAYTYFFYDGELVRDHEMGYHRLQRFNGELTGQDYFLKYLSQYIKTHDKDMYIDWLINLFLKFRTKSEDEEADIWDLPSAFENKNDEII